jgi:hypothetical protein
MRAAVSPLATLTLKGPQHASDKREEHSRDYFYRR